MFDMKTMDFATFEANADAAASLLKAMSNSRRLMILCQLGAGELSVRAIAERVKLSQSALSQHLGKLREEGLVTTRRERQTVYYQIGDPAVEKVILTLAEIFCPELLK